MTLELRRMLHFKEEGLELLILPISSLLTETNY
jgi:hypothetical protein